MNPSIIALSAVAFTAALVAAIFGLAGGAILFLGLNFFYSAKDTVAIHSAVQLISNVSRISVFLKHIEWKVVGLFSILIIPGVYFGSLLYGYFSSNVLSILVGSSLIASVFIPKVKRSSKRGIRFVLLGFVSSFLGMIIGVTGPITASFFMLNNLTKERMIGTKSMCQMLTHIARVIVFSSAIQFNYIDILPELLILGIVSALATIIGKKVLNKLSTQKHVFLNKGLLLLIGAILVFKGLDI